MVDEGTRWIQVMVFYLFLITIIPAAILPRKSLFSVESMRLQMLGFIVSGLLYYLLGAWYIKKGHYINYNLKANNELVDLKSFFI